MQTDVIIARNSCWAQLRATSLEASSPDRMSAPFNDVKWNTLFIYMLFDSIILFASHPPQFCIPLLNYKSKDRSIELSANWDWALASCYGPGTTGLTYQLHQAWGANSTSTPHLHSRVLPTSSAFQGCLPIGNPSPTNHCLARVK